jgi:hypothetical protein
MHSTAISSTVLACTLPGAVVVLGRIQQHPDQVHGVVEQLERPADVPGTRVGGIGQLRVGLDSLLSARRADRGVVLAPLHGP